MSQRKCPSGNSKNEGGKKAARRSGKKGRSAVADKKYRLGRLQRLVLTAISEAEKQQESLLLCDLSRRIAEVRGHTRRPDRKQVHKNTFYRAVQGLCEKGYVRRSSPTRGLRLLIKGRKIVDERNLRWDEEKDTAHKVEQRLLRRKARRKKKGKEMGVSP